MRNLGFPDESTIVIQHPIWCHWCHIRVAPHAEQVRWRGKTFHQDETRQCFTYFKARERNKQELRKRR